MTRHCRKICFITGSRADYGIISRLIKALRNDSSVCIQIIATNMHLSARHGKTISEIERDGFKVDFCIPMDRMDDTPRSIVHSMGEEMIGMADAFQTLNPDLIVILGDRYEMLVAASAALIFSIPVAHLYGGETTEGANDDSIRHAITKLSRIHFTSTEKYRQRIIRMGENPSSVFHVGALGIDNIVNSEIMTLEKLEKSIDFKLGKKYLLVTFHPVTLEPEKNIDATIQLLSALDHFLNQYKILFTLPNSDSDGERIAELIEKWAQEKPNKIKTITSLGRDRYYAALTYTSAVIGNSSSGLIEAPSFGIPTVDIGNRQKGREYGTTVIHCEPETSDIIHAVTKALSPEFTSLCRLSHDNPYALEGTLETITHILTTTPLPPPPFKPFYDSDDVNI